MQWLLSLASWAGLQLHQHAGVTSVHQWHWPACSRGVPAILRSSFLKWTASVQRVVSRKSAAPRVISPMVFDHGSILDSSIDLRMAVMMSHFCRSIPSVHVMSIQIYIYTLWVRKGATIVLPVTSSNANRLLSLTDSLVNLQQVFKVIWHGRIAATHKWFSRICQVVPMCIPYVESRKCRGKVS